MAYWRVIVVLLGVGLCVHASEEIKSPVQDKPAEVIPQPAEVLRAKRPEGAKLTKEKSKSAVLKDNETQSELLSVRFPEISKPSDSLVQSLEDGESIRSKKAVTQELSSPHPYTTTVCIQVRSDSRPITMCGPQVDEERKPAQRYSVQDPNLLYPVRRGFEGDSQSNKPEPIRLQNVLYRTPNVSYMPYLPQRAEPRSPNLVPMKTVEAPSNDKPVEFTNQITQPASQQTPIRILSPVPVSSPGLGNRQYYVSPYQHQPSSSPLAFNCELIPHPQPVAQYISGHQGSPGFRSSNAPLYYMAGAPPVQGPPNLPGGGIEGSPSARYAPAYPYGMDGQMRFAAEGPAMKPGIAQQPMMRPAKLAMAPVMAQNPMPGPSYDKPQTMRSAMDQQQMMDDMQQQQMMNYYEPSMRIGLDEQARQQQLMGYGQGQEVAYMPQVRYGVDDQAMMEHQNSIGSYPDFNTLIASPSPYTMGVNEEDFSAEYQVGKAALSREDLLVKAHDQELKLEYSQKRLKELEKQLEGMKGRAAGGSSEEDEEKENSKTPFAAAKQQEDMSAAGTTTEAPQTPPPKKSETQPTPQQAQKKRQIVRPK